MIVAYVTDPHVRRALLAAAHPEEEVMTDSAGAADAIERGFPRLVVREGVVGRAAPHQVRIPEVSLDDSLLARWEVERWRSGVPAPRSTHLVPRISAALERVGSGPTWVDRALADLSRAAGSHLPPALRTFVRHVLEFPSHYTDLRSLAGASGLSRGALKARFRRRGLDSPYTYLRWCRIIAVAEVLSDRRVTIAKAARRLGFTSDGNMCRTMMSLTDMTPTEVRTVRGWNRLLVTFAWMHLTPGALHAWADLGELFERQVA